MAAREWWRGAPRHCLPLREVEAYYGYGERTMYPYVLPPAGHPWHWLRPADPSDWAHRPETLLTCPRCVATPRVDPAGGAHCKLCNGRGWVVVVSDE